MAEDSERSPSRYPSPEIDNEYNNCDITYPRSPERNVAQNYINSNSSQHLPITRSSNMLAPSNVYNPNQLSPRSPNMVFGHSPQGSPNYQQQSPYAYPRTPSPSTYPLNQTFFNDILSMSLTSVVSQVQCKSALEHIIKEKLAERKDYDNTLKRLWIFQHLIETPCQKCCFLHGDIHNIDGGAPIYKFRIKSKCLANHFRVSGNTPFNWLVRDFCRFHAPHSASVGERKDLREIYYDEFGLFQQQMTSLEFIALAEKLVGRPTTSGKKRTRSKSMENVTSLQVPPAKVPSFERSTTLGTAMSAIKDKNTTTNKSRLVLEMIISNNSQILMSGQNLNKNWNKTNGPIELPTFRPELSSRYKFGRLDNTVANEDKDEPYKFFIDDPAISRSHLEIWFDSFTGWQVMDSGSTLGTVVTSTELVENDGEQEIVPITTALRSGEHRSLKQGDIINLSDGIVKLTILYHKFCSTDTVN